MPAPFHRASALMTTTSQQVVLSTEEIACLRACAEGGDPDPRMLRALAAKGMVQAGDGHALTPAGRHALDVGAPGVVPGIDN
jgi:hypothetical protein